MKEVQSQTGLNVQTSQPGASWYQAMTLTERIPLLCKENAQHVVREQEDQAKALQRLKTWKKQAPFHRSEQTFAQRLAMDGLNEEDLLTLLGQPSRELEAACAKPPNWLVEFFTAFVHPDSNALATLQLKPVGDPPTDAAFQALKPLLAKGFARLHIGISELQQRYTHLPFDPQTVGYLMLPRFLDLFLNKPAKTLVLEVNVARIQGRLQGDTPEERFLYFLQQLAQPEKLLTLYEEYPVLARQLVEMIERWVICELELLQRLCADWDEIRETFAPDSDPGLLTEIKEEAGDIHQGGRSVTLLTWSSGLRLVYKPRSLAIDVHFHELLDWLNARGCQPPFRTAKLLNKQTHGWYEFFSVCGCTTKTEIDRFYQRMGGYAALFYALEGTDFHAENLLATGEDPMFIDLESLFQPHTGKYEGPDVYGYNILTHSVRRSGLLPNNNWFTGDAANVDLSSLGGSTTQHSSIPAKSWKGVATDEMSAKKESVEIRLGTHRPTLQGVETQALEYEQSITAGFTCVYQILLQNRDELLDTILPRFAHDEIRILLRSTPEYVSLLSDSFHPDALRNALDRERLFHRLWVDTGERPYLTRVIAAERADLQNGDIPKFVTYPDSRDLFTSRGERIADFFPASGLELVRKGLKSFGEKDLERQIWLIRASFACVALNGGQSKHKDGLQLLPVDNLATREQYIAEAGAVANRLQQLALVDDGVAGWLVANLVGGKQWRPVPASLDLYNGLPGIALFLAYQGWLSKDSRSTNLAKQVIDMLRTLFIPLWPWKNLGAFDGIGSFIYLFSHLGTIWHDPTFYREAKQLVVRVPELISQDDTFGIISGSAGCIAALLSLYAVAPDTETLAVAIQCGDHLLNKAQHMPQGIGWSTELNPIPLAGLPHGNAGIALSLLRLAAASGEERFHQAALAAMEYERGIFSEERQNWPDLRGAKALPDANNTQDNTYMIAWCHGAPGVGMARLASLQYHDDEAIRAEINTAVQTTFKEGFGRNHALCHGDLGNLETLTLAALLLPERYSRDSVEQLQAVLLESMKAHGWQSGIAYPIETPGLMLGIAGTGYALLRMADPKKIPSLLVLAPPPTSD